MRDVVRIYRRKNGQKMERPNTPGSDWVLEQRAKRGEVSLGQSEPSYEPPANNLLYCDVLYALQARLRANPFSPLAVLLAPSDPASARSVKVGLSTKSL